MAGKHTAKGWVIVTDSTYYGPFNDREQAQRVYNYEFFGIIFGRIECW